MVRILDLFCGAGGASIGLKQAFPDAVILGVDNAIQPNYPFDFHLCDWAAQDLEGFDFIWASPPCQHYTQMLNHGLTSRDKHPDLVAAVREKLVASGVPWCIENVAGAPLIAPGMLCGEMFQLRVIRHRFFETSFKCRFPKHVKHRGTAIRKQGDGGYYFRVYGHEVGKASWGEAMGIDWMRSKELAQAIPPAYSKYIATQWRLSEQV